MLKIDTRKISNKGDLVALIAMLLIACLIGFVCYLAATSNSFLSGFLAASIAWKWKDWFYDPIDQFLENHWPFRE